ncbi:class II aldolase/adducin family protein [Streptomyces sp. 3214.6]|uniref:class II aldolase/adducin family protein n=1 Tax=Streptomyces sp. 3214.6 TaxID=1882757 RepID=UPI00090CBDF4|nr:class II aldolase/adducin family protein [Streptomyces sp. 3214.6]SHH64023.1 L-fuculose-phosphate aldolase [Streptomyces sp. 3214.6]
MTASSSALTDERAAVADACRRLGAEGLLIGTAGNVSVRVEDRVAVTATGAVLARLTPDQVTVVDLDANLVAGSVQPTSELELHLGVYRRYGTGAIVHTHAPMATAVSCVLDELPCIHYQLLALGGTVRVAPYATFGTPELAESVIAALDGRSAALMANHGAVTHATTLDKAVENALLLEWACGVYQRAAAMGRPRVLDEQQQLAVIEAAIARDYGTTHPVPPAQDEQPTKGEGR